ncbi:hypothetical protein HDV00_009510 [Rhizophlyctis rosea]|nr:hypothetical protein HDV00_009510 [Rhizophlyctis rosea]
MNPLLRIDTLECQHLNQFAHPAIERFLWEIAKVHYTFGEITDPFISSNSKADGVGLLSDADKFPVVEGVAAVVKASRRAPESLAGFGGQSFATEIRLVMLEYHDAFFLHEIDSASVPRDATEMLFFVEFYESILKWAALAEQIVASSHLGNNVDTIVSSPYPTTRDCPNSMTVINDQPADVGATSPGQPYDFQAQDEFLKQPNIMTANAELAGNLDSMAGLPSARIGEHTIVAILQKVSIGTIKMALSSHRSCIPRSTNMRRTILLSLSATAGLVPVLAAPAQIANVPPSIEVATDNNYGFNPIASYLVIEDKDITHAEAQSVCQTYNERLATYDASNPTPLFTSVHRSNVARATYWVKDPTDKHRRASSYSKPTAPHEEGCTAYSVANNEPKLVTVPCNSNLPVICTNSAGPTNNQTWTYGVKPTIKVTPPAGPILGFRDTLSFRFLGIPYAKPPTGKRRFALPEAKERFQNPFPAVQPGPRCINSGFLDSGAKHYAEDCLSLEIFTPRIGKDLKEKGLPVFVDIHGGGFTGGGNDDLISSQFGNLASRNNFVVVKPQYRMGFFAVFEDTTKFSRKDVPGNQFLYDVILALKWVQNNIAHFGGDPTNVTIHGQSAGAWIVRWLLSSPLSNGLYHRAIMRSDGQPPAFTPAVAAGLGQALMKNVSCTTLDCIRKVPFQTILDVQRDVLQATGQGSFLATVDGVSIPDQFHRLLQSGKFNKVPMIFTSVNNEVGGTPIIPVPMDQTTALAFLQAGNPIATPNITYPLLTQLYGADPSPGADWSIPVSLLWTDSATTCSTRYIARLAGSTGLPVRVGTWTGAGIRASFNAPYPHLCNDKNLLCHSDDNAVAYAFTEYDINSTIDLKTIKPESLVLSRQWGDIIQAFARSGVEDLKKDVIGGLDWPTINSTKVDGVLLGQAATWEGGVRKGSYGSPVCDLLDQLGPYSFLYS